MFFTVYKITNLKNNRYYIGVHRTEDLNDAYMGSGKAIKAAIRKHGKESFKKEILFVFDNSEDMMLKESELVKVGPESYNLIPGGISPGFPRGINHSETSKEKMRLSAIGKHDGCKNGNWKRDFGHETKSRMSASQSHCWIIEYPDGSKETISNLKKFCINNNLDPASMHDVFKGSRRHHKGYKCSKLESVSFR